MINSVILLLFLVAGSFTYSAKKDDDACVVTKFENVEEATEICKNVFVDDLFVPAGQTLVLDLQNGATLTFRGNVTFGYVNWAGPLMRIYGNGVTVQGEKGHVLNGQGELYWDDKGSWGEKKPKFIIIQATNSVFRNLHLYHAPMHGIAINNSHNVVFTDFLIDNAAGAENVAPLGHAGHNTDGFGVNRSSSIVIKDSTVFNQDDCVVLNSGSDIYVANMFCHGSHGLSLSVGFSNDSIEANILTDVLIENSTIIDAMDGIHIKTHIDAGLGVIRNVTYRNIVMIGSYSKGIAIEQNYTNAPVSNQGAPPLDNIPIIDLKFSNIKGSVQNESIPYYIVCAKYGCSDWEWDDISIYGQQEGACVNFHPDAISCVDYTV